MEMLLETGILGLFFFMLPFVYVLRALNAYKKYFVSQKNINTQYVKTFIIACLILPIYFLFQPYGVVEFPYLGLVLGIGLYALSLNYEVS
jgi:hypothetical protein